MTDCSDKCTFLSDHQPLTPCAFSESSKEYLFRNWNRIKLIQIVQIILDRINPAEFQTKSLSADSC